MIEPRPRPASPASETDSDRSLRRPILEWEIDFHALLAEKQVPLEELLEYGIGSVIDLGSAAEVRVRVRFGEVDLAVGSVVTIDDSPPLDENRTENHQKSPARPRLGVRLDDVSWDRLGDILRS